MRHSKYHFVKEHISILGQLNVTRSRDEPELQTVCVMGIQNLLPFVAKSCRQGNISEFAGCSVAIDVSCLLHRGLFGCMEDRAVGKDNRAYIYYVKKYVDALLALNCHVIMVFDGRPLPAKKDTNAERSAKRKENMRQGEILLSQGRTEEAGSLFRQSTSITREVVETTIQHFRKSTLVDIIVAPYESDAQLAFLTREKLADAVVTEDSDLIAFGCEKIIFKWDVSGPCTIYDRNLLPNSFSGKMASEFDFTTFRRICILSGCDYTQGLKGVGLSKALQFFLKTSKTDLKEILPRVPSYLRMPKLQVTDEFIKDFIRAEKTFLHQIVYDPRGRCQRPLTPYPLEEEKENSQDKDVYDDDDDDFVPRLSQTSGRDDDHSFAGSVVSSSQSTRLALGNNSQGSSLEDIFHLPAQIPVWSIWSSHYETRSKRLDSVRNEEKVEKEKKLRMGAFRMDSPERRRKKMIAVDDEDDILLLDDDDDFATTSNKKKSKKPSPKKSRTAPVNARNHTKKNEATSLMSAEGLMAIYSIDKSTPTVSADLRTTSASSPDTLIAPSHVLEVVIENMCVHAPPPKPDKGTTLTDQPLPGRKRSCLDAIGAAEQAEKRFTESLPSPIKKELTPPMVSFERPMLDGDMPITGASNVHPSPKTSTPLSGRSRSLMGGKSAYFGINRPSSLSNPFKKPRLLPPGESPAGSSATPIVIAAESPGVLDRGMLLTPKGSCLTTSLNDKLGVNVSVSSSPFGAIFRSGTASRAA
ncbi:exo-1 [Pristionchus pacificus]|nr:exo-1 [Pristionchus pacificus]|eukprot:PDM74724.1 exo-1 [Pristionchus pacificus]